MQETEVNQDRLIVLWTSGDREVALNMAFMYTLNSKIRDWWNNVTLVIWGPSAKLVTEDTELQEYLEKMREAGVDLMACKKCAENYGVSEGLEKLGVDVIPMGQPLTHFLKKGCRVLTF